MADLVTHVAFGYFAGKSTFSTHLRTIFYVGCILPDILTRPFYIIFPSLYWLVEPFHTPVVLILICALFALFFTPNLRKKIFYALVAGVGCHLLVDLFQTNIVDGYLWFYPFSWETLHIGFYKPEQSLYLMPILLIIIISIEIIAYFKWKRQNLTYF